MLPLLARSKVKLPWYLSGAIPKSNCIAAYAPKGAASYAASKVNLVTPGTHDAVDGAAYPTWNATDGWIGNGTTQYLTTDITPDGDYSVVVMLNTATPQAGNILGAVTTLPSTNRFSLQYGAGPGYAIVYSKGTTQVTVAPSCPSGVLAISELNAYRMGCLDSAIGGAWGVPLLPIYIFCRNLNSAANGFWAGNIQYLAIYNTALTSSQLSSITRSIYGESYSNNYVVTDMSGQANHGTGYFIGTGRVLGRAKFVYQSYINIYSADLASDFNGKEGSLMARMKVNSAADWSDAVQRDPIRIDGSGGVDQDIVAFDRTASADELRCYYAAGGVYYGVTTTDLNGTLDWFTATVTWSRSNTRCRGYANGIQQGVDVVVGTDFVNPLANNAGFGTAHQAAPDYLWGGSMGPVLLANRELTPAEVASLNTTFTLANAQSILGANLIGWWELDE
jgi:hypothetical protein